jgi:hypothetical protein
LRKKRSDVRVLDSSRRLQPWNGFPARNFGLNFGNLSIKIRSEYLSARQLTNDARLAHANFRRIATENIRRLDLALEPAPPSAIDSTLAVLACQQGRWRKVQAPPAGSAVFVDGIDAQ